ncbi:DUF4271 domain-containing protein [Flagellimonas pacifica]|uniref:DUF4271 domain-containing protein n=1 Tax=Flagellimonas pacifica TaxID=1247520 RepID=A0A285MBV6_9FLAO|nr:DUF4271 domain-containing protein [Allomuricauda parva]SNY94619.1 protein of unknown function [Allomuricauda parva]
MNPIYKAVESLDWITIVLFFSMVVLALGKYLFQSRFWNFMILPFNNRYVVLYNKKGQLLNWFHILLTIFQLVNLSLFVFLLQKDLFNLSSQSPVQYFFTIMGVLVLFQIIKVLLQFTKGFVFNTMELVSELSFSKITYLNYSSLIMFISNIVLVYIFKDSKIVLYTALILIVSINLIGVAKLLKNHQKAIISYFLYFILYLCALEIAPLVIVGSYLKD